MSLGIGEMILLAGIALVVIGPEKFPEFAKVVLRTINDVRGYMNDVKYDLSRELHPIKRDLDAAMRPDPIETPYEAPRNAQAWLEDDGERVAPDQTAPEGSESDSTEAGGAGEKKPPPASDGYDD